MGMIPAWNIFTTGLFSVLFEHISFARHIAQLLVEAVNEIAFVTFKYGLPKRQTPAKQWFPDSINQKC
jgi:hypothetical protein